jgi:hypothetical protein
MPEPDQPNDHQVQISHQYHAFLVATVDLRDPGLGRHADLTIDGKPYTASVSIESVRQAARQRGKTLTGRWRATLGLRTLPDASLAPRLFLRRVRAPGDAALEQPEFWALTADVVAVDAATGLLEVRLPSRSGKGDGFSIHVRADAALLERARGVRHVHVKGGLEGGYLVAVDLEPRDTVQVATTNQRAVHRE